eukprot:560823_1
MPVVTVAVMRVDAEVRVESTAATAVSARRRAVGTAVTAVVEMAAARNEIAAREALLIITVRRATVTENGFHVERRERGWTGEEIVGNLDLQREDTTAVPTIVREEMGEIARKRNPRKPKKKLKESCMNTR